MKVILVGLGVVGGGLVDLLARRSRELRGRGLEFKIVAAVDSRGAAVDGKGLDAKQLLARKRRTGRIGTLEKTALEVISDVEADAVLELTPATMDGEPALTHIKAALRHSKSVVTANKMPLALHYRDLLRESKKRGVQILYGASIGAGIPVIDLGRDCAATEPVDRIEGVLNATTNFILSEMEQGAGYARALREAQRLGYAETDPSFDVDGLDAACKLVVLANDVMRGHFQLRDVKPLSGIGRVTMASVKRAREKGKALRLVARAGSSLSVGVAEVEGESPLAVRGPSHAVVFGCRYSGDRAIVGSGAGSVTTPLGVLRDLIALADGVGDQIRRSDSRKVGTDGSWEKRYNR